MWNWIPKDENKPSSVYPEATHIGKSIVIKGEVSGSEDVYVAGELEGSIELLEGNLTVGPEARIRANVQACSIVVHGRVDGTLYGTKRVDLKKSAVLVGDIYTPRFHRRGRIPERKRAGSEGHSRPPKKESGRNGRREIARATRISGRLLFQNDVWLLPLCRALRVRGGLRVPHKTTTNTLTNCARASRTPRVHP